MVPFDFVNVLLLLFIKVNYLSCFDSVFASSKGYFVFHEQYSISDKQALGRKKHILRAFLFPVDKDI